ncbi:MAG: 4-hydroxyphenylacetate 3-hydroxylase N-terminal domain-containing protein [Chloroflexia bacterium]
MPRLSGRHPVRRRALRYAARPRAARRDHVPLAQFRDPVGLSFLTPRNADDLLRRRRMMELRARSSGGMLGRTPDYLNSAFMAMAAAAPFFEQGDPRWAENILSYYEYIREHDLVLTHSLINPQAD